MLCHGQQFSSLRRLIYEAALFFSTILKRPAHAAFQTLEGGKTGTVMGLGTNP